MIISGTTKVASGLLLAGVAGGTGAYFYLNNSDKEVFTTKKEEAPKITVSGKLTEIGYLVLSTEGTDDDGQWDELLKAYNAIKQTSDVFEGKKVGQDETKDGIKAKCKSALGSDFSEQNNGALAKRWCVKIETINDMLTRNNYEKIGTSVSNTGNADKWKAKAVALHKIAKESRAIDVDLKGNDGDGKLLEDSCSKIKTDTAKTYEGKDFEKTYNQIKDWCSIKKD